MKSPQKIHKPQDFQKQAWNPFPPLPSKDRVTKETLATIVTKETADTHVLMKHLLEIMTKFMTILQPQE